MGFRLSNQNSDERHMMKDLNRINPAAKLAMYLFAFLLAACATAPERNAGAQQALQGLVDKARINAEAPAFAAVIVKDDKTDMAVSGRRSMNKKTAAEIDDQWHIGSVTKMMIASLVARYVEKGEISWDTTIGELFSDAEPNIHPQYRDATLKHFLAHRSGMRLDSDAFSTRMSALTAGWIAENGAAGPPPIGFAECDFTGDPKIDRFHWARAALQEPPAAPLGEPKRIYENGNYIVLAALLEHVTGRIYEDLMREMLFEPLGMSEAGFGPPGDGALDEPYGHHRNPEGVTEIFPPNGPARPDNPPVMSPSGRVHASLSDMAKFMRDHIAGHRGEKALMAPEIYQALHTPPFGDDYAFGWILRDSGGIGHGGANGKWLAIVEIRPEENAGVFVATNLGPPSETAPAANALITELFDLIAD